MRVEGAVWAHHEYHPRCPELEGPERLRAWALMDDTVLVEPRLGARPELSALVFERLMQGLLGKASINEEKKLEEAKQKKLEVSITNGEEEKKLEEEQKKVDEDLLTAAKKGNEEGVRDLLAKGANPNGAKDVR